MSDLPSRYQRRVKKLRQNIIFIVIVAVISIVLWELGQFHWELFQKESQSQNETRTTQTDYAVHRHLPHPHS